MSAFTLGCVLAVSLAVTGRSSPQQGSAAQQPARNRAQLSNAATDMMADAQNARKAIAKNDKSGAQKLVNDAVNKLKEVQSMARGQTVVPIYTEIATVAVWEPSEIVQPTSGSAERQNTATAGQATVGPPPKAAIQDMARSVTAVTVNLPSAANHINASKAALDRGDMKAADSALAQAEGAVIAESVAADLPLIRARENLVLARQRAQANDWPSTRTALKAASDALSDHAAGQGLQHAADASSLKKQIDEYAGNLDKHHEDAAKRIENWWEQAAAWTQQGTTRR